MDIGMRNLIMNQGYMHLQHLICHIYIQEIIILAGGFTRLFLKKLFFLS